MSEYGEGPPQPEKELSQEELNRAVTELTDQFNAQFENSVIKEVGQPQVIPISDFRAAFGTSSDSRILIYDDPFNPDKAGWRVDQSENDRMRIVRHKGSIIETVILATGESPSVGYKFLDKKYKDNPRQLPELMISRQSENTQSVINKAKEIIGDIPQVEK
jgi:hypothetical protein